MNIAKIARVIGAGVVTDMTPVRWLLTDSRSLSFTQGTLFFALRTEHNDGHKYINNLYKNGVRYFVVEKSYRVKSSMQDATFLKVKDTLVALQMVAFVHRCDFRIPIIGITGSNGKTIVKEWLYQLLRAKHIVTRSPRSYNSQIGVPLSVWQLDQWSEVGIFEAGISKQGEMKRIEPIINPTISIVTNIGDAHQEHFTSYEEKCKEKLNLTHYSDIFIYNKDCALIDQIAQEQDTKTLTWGRTAGADVELIDAVVNQGKTNITYCYQGNREHYTLPFTDKASIENSMHCLCCLLYMEYEPKEIGKLMLQLESVAMRLEVKEGVRNCLVINDSYNSDLTSLSIALDFLDQQTTNQGRTKTIILSDISQTGQTTEELYSTVGTLLANRQIDHIVGIGQEIGQHRNKFCAKQLTFYESTEEYILHGAHEQLHNEVVLLKGGRQFSFERISKLLERTTHETILEVNLSALIENMNYFRSLLTPGTKLMGMIKAFAYGSGAIEIARTLQHHGCDYLAVAVADEGAELRESGIHIPIVVMDPYPNAFDIIFEHHLEPEIYSFKLLEEFIEAADRQGLSNYPIHLKIDSGMKRLGFEEDMIEALGLLLSKQQSVRVSSIFSHLATADDAQQDTFTLHQLDTFARCAEQLEATLPYTIMKHVLNSAGIERFTTHQYDMVRLGIGYYGISAQPSTPLATVCTLKTVILQTKIVQAGESIGYGRNTFVDKDTRIGIIPIGYADGFDRKLGNGAGEVWVDSVRCKVLGNVCMDLSMIDLSQTSVMEGDPVEVFGTHITLSEVAEKIGTISYEVLTGVSRRVKRVYYQE